MISPRTLWWWHRIGSLLCLTLCWLLFSLRLKRPPGSVPATGPLLIIANHQSFLDPILVGLAVGRRMNYMARKSLWKSRLLGYVMDRLGAFPVDHAGPAIEGVRACLKLLSEGEAVVIFPEGARTPNGKIQQLKAGAAIILRRQPVPILPVGVAGAYEALPIWRKWPHLAPLGLPGTAGLAAVVGRVIPPKEYQDKNTPLFVDDLYRVLLELSSEAQKIRKKE